MRDTGVEDALLELSDEEWVDFSDKILDVLTAIHEMGIRPVQLMILYAVQHSTKLGVPYDKQSIAERIGQPRQTVYRLITDLEERNYLRSERVGHQHLVYLGDECPDLGKNALAVGIMNCADVLARATQWDDMVESLREKERGAPEAAD